jgi:hypothetical protein
LRFVNSRKRAAARLDIGGASDKLEGVGGQPSAAVSGTRHGAQAKRRFE